MNKLNNYTNSGLLIIRIGLGIMMIFHGYPKLLGGIEKWMALGKAMSNLGINFIPAFWGFAAAITETLGGVLILLGLFFRPACLFILFTMIVASIQHFSEGDGINGASHAIELGFVFLGLFFVGAGKYSLDKK